MAKPRLEPQTAGFVHSATLLYPGAAGSCRRLFRGVTWFNIYFRQITTACDIQCRGPEDWETGSLLGSQLRDGDGWDQGGARGEGGGREEWTGLRDVWKVELTGRAG